MIRLFQTVAILMPILTSACGGNYGYLQSSRDITGNFMQKQFNPEYTYYYTGRSAIPYAIVGIKKAYVLDSVFWTPIDNASGELSRLTERLYGSDFKKPYGAGIFDPTGKRAGIWYSVYASTRVQFGPDNRINVFSPYIPTRHSRVFD